MIAATIDDAPVTVRYGDLCELAATSRERRDDLALKLAKAEVIGAGRAVEIYTGMLAEIDEAYARVIKALAVAHAAAVRGAS